ncbi:MAG TPA: aminotransferase class IV [Solirubrobacterales bacterium]|jgi:branched-chain amino acid aminotransferase|nr:aminotransferase class IV [Solirubrobacterales bacterium]
MPLRELASVDGEIAPTRESTLPLPDDGLYRGDGVFEVIRLYRGQPFALREHLDRIERSASAIELPVERELIESELDALLAEHGDDDGQLRIVLTRGGRRVLLTEELPPRGATVRLATVTYGPSVILDGVKSLSYAANMQATRIAVARGADEALLVRPDGTVLEAPTSAVFWVSAEGGLRTPSLEAGILESITRAKIVIALHVEEGQFDVGDVRAAGEAFLASTTREVQPVAAIDDRELEAPGERTREAQSAFEAVLQGDLGGVAG